MNIEVLNTVFCDQIRREDNGKALLIGVYTDGFVPETIPTSIQLSIWLSLKFPRNGDFEIEIQLKTPKDELSTNIGSVSIMDSDSPMNIYMADVPANITAPGKIELDLIFKDGTRLNAGSLALVYEHEPETSHPS